MQYYPDKQFVDYLCNFYVRLSFGCRSSPKIFDNFSKAICFIAEHNYKVKHILHLLDDCLTIDPPNFDAERTMTLMMIFKRLKVPIAAHKTMGPLTCIQYLGIILDIQINLKLDYLKRK